MINVGPYDGLYAEGFLIAMGIAVGAAIVPMLTPIPVDVAFMMAFALVLYLVAGVMEVSLKIDEQREEEDTTHD